MKTTNHAAHVADQANRAMNLEPDEEHREEMRNVLRETIERLEALRRSRHRIDRIILTKWRPQNAFPTLLQGP